MMTILYINYIYIYQPGELIYTDDPNIAHNDSINFMF